MSSDAGRGGVPSAADAALEEAAGRDIRAVYARRARPSWAIYLVALCGLVVVPALMLAETLAPRLAQTPLDGVPPELIVWTALYPVYVMLTLVDLSRAQRDHLQVSLLHAVLPPVQVLARVVRHRSWTLAGSVLGSAAMFAAWFAPLPWVNRAAALLGLG